MTQYILTYLGGDQLTSPEAGKEHFAAYQVWLGTLGDAAIAPMVPIKNTHTVHPDGTVTAGSSIAMSGYTIVQADSLEQALSYAKSCPFLGINGRLEVAELVQM